MNVRGPCSSCGASLATDQRYCVECGQRVGPPLALPYAIPAQIGEVTAPASRWAFALPVPMQTVTTFAAIALGFGVVVGTAISPNLAGIVASPSPTVVAQAPPPETPSTPSVASGGGGGGGGAPVASAPASTVASSTPTGSSGGGSGGGGGGKKKKKKKKKPETQTLTGTVVRVNPFAQSYAISTGGLLAIHASSMPQVGDKLEVPVRKLANGTYAEAGTRNAVGTTDSVEFTGTVTYCGDLEQPSAPCDGSSATDHYAYTVSGLGASVLVSINPPAQAALPKLGSSVDVTVHIGDPFQPIAAATPLPTDSACTPPYDEQNGIPATPDGAKELTQTAVSVSSQATSANVEAVVQTICPGDSPKLVLSADDVREAGRDLPELAVPGGMDLSKLTPGLPLKAAVDVGQDGTLNLTGIASDQGAAGADDPTQGQGSLSGQ
jgi:hypothetical protein